MEERVKAAIAKFEGGYDCSHAILSAYADLFEFDERSMQAIQKPCGCMMGRPQTVCGAVMGAMKVLNRKLRSEEETGTPKIKKSDLVREFRRRFEELNGAVACSELLGVDLNDREGLTAAMDNDLFRTHCEKYITDSATILEDLIELKGRVGSPQSL